MREWRARKKVPPVLLITGAPGTGKRAVAWFLSQWILCERNGLNETAAEEPGLFGEAPSAAPAVDENADPLPCGECPNCQKALRGNLVDFTEILPEQDETTLKIDQFRNLRASAGFGAHEGQYRIFLIPDSERMTAQAANSILKILEEPPRGWIFLLTASDPTLLLPTIVSRCQKLRLKPFDRPTIEELLDLAEVRADRRAVCAALAHGSWSRALALASDEIWEQRKAILSFLQDAAPSLTALIDWASSQSSNFDLLLDQLENLVADLVRWSSVTPPVAAEKFGWANSDARAALASHAQDMLKRLGGVDRARGFWIDRAERIARARQEATAPLNRKLLIQDILMHWMASKGNP